MFYSADGTLDVAGKHLSISEEYLLRMETLVTDDMLKETRMNSAQRQYVDDGTFYINVQNVLLFVRLGDFAPYVIGEHPFAQSRIAVGDQWIHNWIATHE